MARLIAALIRHGDYHQLADTPSAHQPFPLNARGMEQAKQAALQMRSTLEGTFESSDWTLDSEVDSSMLLRAWQTARIFCDELSDRFPSPPVIGCHEALAERGLGSAANLTTRQIAEVIAADPRYETPPVDWKSDSHYRLPLQGAESLMEAGHRVAEHMTRQMARMAREGAHDESCNRVKLFFGHGAAFRHAAHLLGVLAFDDIARLSMYHAEPVYLEYDADGDWRHLAGRWKVRGQEERYND